MSSDPTSTEKRAGAEERVPEDALETIDQSLEAIIEEVQRADGAPSAAPDASPPPALETSAPPAPPTSMLAGALVNFPPTESVTAEVLLPIPPEALRPPQ